MGTKSLAPCTARARIGQATKRHTATPSIAAAVTRTLPGLIKPHDRIVCPRLSTCGNGIGGVVTKSAWHPITGIAVVAGLIILLLAAATAPWRPVSDFSGFYAGAKFVGTGDLYSY